MSTPIDGQMRWQLIQEAKKRKQKNPVPRKLYQRSRYNPQPSPFVNKPKHE